MLLKVSSLPNYKRLIVNYTLVSSKNIRKFCPQKINEKTKHRIVGLTLETRPDFITKKETKRMRWLGCTRIELGVQSIYNDVLKKNKRGHNIEKTIKAID